MTIQSKVPKLGRPPTLPLWNTLSLAKGNFWKGVRGCYGVPVGWPYPSVCISAVILRFNKLQTFSEDWGVCVAGAFKMDIGNFGSN